MSKLYSVLTLIITVLIVLPTFAKENNKQTAFQFTEQQKIEMAIKNYKKALESDNLGMIESAIINVMKLKYQYPDYNYSSLVQPLAALENNEMNRSIKFMSYIVKNYLVHPDRYAWMEEVQLKFDKDLPTVFTQKIAQQVGE